MDRRRLRGRDTRQAILEALQSMQTLEEQETSAAPLSHGPGQNKSRREIARAIATLLDVHPATVCAHLKQLQHVKRVG
jgi:hypothetical protein